jgi:acetate kinase
MIAVLGGVDAVIFTGGIGENASRLRFEIGGRFGFVGVVLDRQANAGPELDVKISAYESAVDVLVVRSREDLAILRAVRALGANESKR